MAFSQWRLKKNKQVIKDPWDTLMFPRWKKTQAEPEKLEPVSASPAQNGLWWGCTSGSRLLLGFVQVAWASITQRNSAGLTLELFDPLLVFIKAQRPWFQFGLAALQQQSLSNIKVFLSEMPIDTKAVSSLRVPTRGHTRSLSLCGSSWILPHFDFLYAFPLVFNFWCSISGKLY